MTKRRILVLTSTFPRWKSDTEPGFVFELSKNLVRNGYSVDVIAPHAPGAKHFEELEGLRVYRYQYFFERFQGLSYQGGISANLKSNKLNYLLIPFFFIFQFFTIINRVKNDDYDLIHAHWLIPQAFMAVLASKYIPDFNTPILCTSHGADLYTLNSFFLKRVKKWVAKYCVHVCVVSNAMKNFIEKSGIKNKDVSVLSMGVDLKNIFIPSKEIKRIDNRLIFVGRFVDKKGIPVLIKALSKVVLLNPDVELLLVGDGPLRQEISAMVMSYGLEKNISFYGSEIKEKLPKLYSSASIAVVPSIIDKSGDTEGLGLVTIEAMGCECVVVASELEPIKEVIEDQITGILFQPGNSEQLSQCLIDLLNNKNKRESISKEGRKKSKQLYDWENITIDYCKLMESLFLK